jgi:hypothetical protein
MSTTGRPARRVGGAWAAVWHSRPYPCTSGSGRATHADKIGAMFDDAVIREAGRRILEAAPRGSRLILFGSHARGQASEHSDLAREDELMARDATLYECRLG